jgi:type I restriction enzyme, S subunit
VTHSWPSRSLRQCGRWISGGTPLRANAKFWGGDIPWISAKSIKHLRLTESPEQLTPAGAAEVGTVERGTVLFVVRGMSLAKEFRVGVAERTLSFNQDLRAIHPSADVDPYYLARFLAFAAPQVLRMVGDASHGTKRLPTDLLDVLPVPVPPLAEQKRIAAVLDKADDLRGKRRQALATLDTLLQSVFLDMFGDFSKGVKRWPLRPLGELAASTQLGLVRSSEQFGEGYEYPYVRMNAITSAGELDHSVVKRTDATAAEIAQCRLAPGDFLFNTRNSRELVGKSAVFEGAGVHLFNNNVMRIRFKPSVDPYFVLRYFHTQIGEASLEAIKAGTTSVFAIYWSKLKDLPIPVPPVELQAEYGRVAGSVRQQRVVMRSSISQLDALFAALQSAAFAGTLFRSPQLAKT